MALAKLEVIDRRPLEDEMCPECSTWAIEEVTYTLTRTDGSFSFHTLNRCTRCVPNDAHVRWTSGPTQSGGTPNG